MTKTVSRYTASEALQMMKANYPTNFQQVIDTGKQLIIRITKLYKTDDYTKAYQRYLNSGCSNESEIMMLCALQQLNDEKKKETESYRNTLYGMLEERDQLLGQQEHNERATNINDSDKKMLRQFYREKIDEITKRIDQHALSIEVVDAVVIDHPNLFTGYASA